MELKCKICGSSQFELVLVEKYQRQYLPKCYNCGIYNIYNSELVEHNKVVIAGYLYEINNAERTKNDDDYYLLNKAEIEKIIASPLIPRTISEKILKLLEYVNKRTTYLGEGVIIPLKSVYINSHDEFLNILTTLYNQGLITDPEIRDSFNSASTWPVALTWQGIKYVEEHKPVIKNNQCFVAMWFDAETDRLWAEAIRPGCLRAGYNPVRIDKHQHNNNIVDEILSGVRKSRFLIADFTGQNRGVYYEAGFAKGLGKEVIQLCRKDYFSGEESDQRMHFDNVQVNTLIWEEGKVEELSKLIQYRIESIFGSGDYIPEDLDLMEPTT